MKSNKILEFRSLLRLFERELGIQNTSNCCFGVTLSQCHVLLELDKQDNLILKELAERMFLDKSTLSRTVDGLVNLGLLLRETPKKNRRTIAIKLTDQGLSVCKRINSYNNNYFQEVFEGLSEKNLNIFLSTLDEVVKKMIEINNLKSIT